jgi:hypothetical protein
MAVNMTRLYSANRDVALGGARAFTPAREAGAANYAHAKRQRRVVEVNKRQCR